MPYVVDIYRFKNSIEYEYKYAGKCGAKGEKRAPKKKATRAQMEKQNQINRENRLRRVIKANFEPGDLWCCCKYPEGYRIPFEELKKDIRNFIAKLRKEYRKHGAELKWVSRMEVGKMGGLHAHVLVNRIWNIHTDLLLENIWTDILRKRGVPEEDLGGKLDHRSIYEAGGFQSLAEYITKKPEEDSKEYEQLSLFPPAGAETALKHFKFKKPDTARA